MYCGSLSDLAVYLNTFSKSIIKDKNYAGVEIAVVDGNEIRVYDNDFDTHRAKNRRKALHTVGTTRYNFSLPILSGNPPGLNIIRFPFPALCAVIFRSEITF